MKPFHSKFISRCCLYSSYTNINDIGFVDDVEMNYTMRYSAKVVFYVILVGDEGPLPAMPPPPSQGILKKRTDQPPGPPCGLPPPLSDDSDNEETADQSGDEEQTDGKPSVVILIGPTHEFTSSYRAPQESVLPEEFFF